MIVAHREASQFQHAPAYHCWFCNWRCFLFDSPCAHVPKLHRQCFSCRMPCTRRHSGQVATEHALFRNYMLAARLRKTKTTRAHSCLLALLRSFLGRRIPLRLLNPKQNSNYKANSRSHSLYIKAKHQSLCNLDVLLVRLHKLAGLAMHMTVLC